MLFTAVLDTCVLWPNSKRDFLLSLAVEGLYRPIWSERILAELSAGLRRRDLSRGVDPKIIDTRLDKLLTNLRVNFVDSSVSGWEMLEGKYQLPDPRDEHVVAVAEFAQAGVIVTENLKDFPEDKMPMGIVAQHPREFLLNAIHIDPQLVGQAVLAMSERSGRHGPKLDSYEYLEKMIRTFELEEVRSFLRPHLMGDSSNQSTK